MTRFGAASTKPRSGISKASAGRSMQTACRASFSATRNRSSNQTQPVSMPPDQHDSRAVELVAAIVLVACVAWLLVGPVYSAGLRIERSNEGWNAIQAMHAFDGSLYPPPGSLINNYPPIWPYLIGSFTRLGADPIISGRIVALAAFLAIGLGLFALLRAFRTSPIASAIGALSFMFMAAGLLSNYVGLAEPQMLAEALSVWGAVALVKSRHPPQAMAAAVITLIALFTKQIVIALPIACFFWIATYRRKLLWPWVGTLIALACLSLFALFLAYGQNFVANLLFPRVFSFTRLMTNLALISKVAVPLIFFAAVCYRKQGQSEAVHFAWFAILSGIFVIILFGSARGVSINIVFDLAIGCSIGMGVAWHQLSHASYPTRRANVVRALVVAALLARVGIGTPYAAIALPVDQQVRTDLKEASAFSAMLIHEIAKASDPVACEALSICVWSGHLSEVDLWRLHYETTLTPFVDERSLLEAIKQGTFGAIVLFGNSNPVQDRNLPGLGAALASGYRPPIVSGDDRLSLFLPKQARP